MHNARMNYRAIIRDAWSVTQNNKRLIWWLAFAPSVLSTLVAMGYLSYQAVAFYTSPYINSHASEDGSAFSMVIDLIKNIFNYSPGLGAFLAILTAFVLLAYLMLPVFTQGGLIKTLARNREGHPILIREAVSNGFTRFLQLFEYHALVRTFSLISILTEMSFVLRNLGPDAFALFVWILGLALLVGIFLSTLFTYSEYFIVLNKTGVFEGMIASAGMVLRQWHHTLFMFLLMAVIAVRIFINLLVALLIPGLIVLPIFLFANITLAGLGVVVGSIAGLIALYFTSYFLGIFHVFTSAVWTFTFLELTQADES
jgi:hypothetical protein